MSSPDYLQETYLSFPVDLPCFKGEPSWSLPMPVHYIVNRAGVIVAADFDPNYTGRPEPQKTLEVLDKMG